MYNYNGSKGFLDLEEKIDFISEIMPNNCAIHNQQFFARIKRDFKKWD